jgi:hypothetical protein
MGLFAPSLHAVAAKREESGPIFGEWNGSDAASTARVKGLPAGEQYLNAAELVKGNPCLRLEHKLQTATGATASNAAAISLGAHGTGRHPFSSNAADTRLARCSGRPHPLKGFGIAYAAVGALVFERYNLFERFWHWSGPKLPFACLPPSLQGSQSWRTCRTP